MRMIALAVGCGLVAAACALEDLDDSPQEDAGPSGPDAEPGDGLESRCDTDVSESTVCLEAAAGRPGDTVEVEVHVLLDESACDAFDEAFTTVEYDHEVFELASEQVDGDCYKLDDYEYSDGSRVVDWYIAADVDGNTDCPEPFAPGFQRTIEFTILPGAPEDDYTLPLEAATVEAADERCTGYGSRAGLVRVLPPP